MYWEDVYMAQTVNVNFKLDEDVKKSEVPADPFYSDSNMAHLRRGIAALNAGNGVEHEPIEDD